jgi:hypothetical protein
MLVTLRVGFSVPRVVAGAVAAGGDAVADGDLLRADEDVLDEQAQHLWVPITLSVSCDQAIFVDRAAGGSVSSDAVRVEIDRVG